MVHRVDSADKQPCIGTGTSLQFAVPIQSSFNVVFSGGVVQWKITGVGKNGHSGLPQNAINPLILAYEATVEVMKRFHEDYPAHPVCLLFLYFLFVMIILILNNHTNRWRRSTTTIVHPP